MINMLIWLCDSTHFSILYSLFNRSTEEVRVAYRAWYVKFELHLVIASLSTGNEIKLKTNSARMLGLYWATLSNFVFPEC